MSQLKGLAAIVRGGMAENSQTEDSEQKESVEILDTRPTATTRRSAAPKTPLRTVGKSSNPAYEPVKVYVRSEIRKKAVRKWEDEGGRDLSDLIEVLFSKYLSA
jgi:hypothetical protein